MATKALSRMQRTDPPMTKLKAAVGTDEANVGTTDYKIPTDRIIDVPDDQVADLIARCGFSVVDDDLPAPDGSVNMRAPSDCDGCSVGGISYVPDKNGIVNVPAVSAVDLMSHGFVAV
jgi:hypothetical protein